MNHHEPFQHMGATPDSRLLKHISKLLVIFRRVCGRYLYRSWGATLSGTGLVILW